MSPNTVAQHSRPTHGSGPNRFWRLSVGADWCARILDRVQQRVSDHRFRQVRGSQGPSQLHIGRAHPSGHENGRQVRLANLFAQDGKQPHPVHARQTNVKDGNVRATTFGNHAQRRLGVLNGYDRVTSFADP
jgi:hypothetical protein